MKIKLLFFITTFIILQSKSFSQTAIDLPGTTDDVLVPYQINLSNNAFTIEFDAFYYNFNLANALVTQTIGNNANPIDLYVNFDGSLNLTLGNGSNQHVFNNIMPPNSIPVGNWFHFAVVVDDTMKMVSIYLNGSPVGIANYGVSLNNTGQTLIGNRNDNFTNSNARFDNVRFWSSARTGSQINANLTACLSGNEPNLEVYYDFENLSGSVVPDLALNNGAQDGMIQNGGSSNSGTGCTPEPQCTNPDTPLLTLSENNVCPNTTITIDIAGSLNDGTAWHVYEGSCGGNLVGTTTTSSFDVSPFITTTYYVRGEGGCTTPFVCDAVIVFVEDAIAPNAVAQDITVQLDVNGVVSITPNEIDNGSSDNCNVNLSLDRTDFTCADISSPIQVTLTVTDDSGNTDDEIALVTVEDVIAPNAVAQDITVQLDANGVVSITPNQIDNGSSDNCSVNLSLDRTDFTCADISSPIQVTLTVTDDSGNTDDAIVLVTVEDVIAPNVVAQDITVQLDANGVVSITPNQIDNGSSDNCSVNLSLDRTDFTCADISSPIQVTLTVTDNFGNTDTDSSTVTVEDNIAPTAIAQDITIQLDENGLATIAVTDIDNGSADNCSVNLSLNQTDFDCNSGNIPFAFEAFNTNNTITVILTATDDFGNSDTATASVTLEDNIAPTAVAKDITVQLDANGLATITASDIDNGSTDNCNVNLSLNQTDFSCTDVGTPVQVTLTVTDDSGNTDTDTATVIVEDNIAPTAIAQDVTVYLDANGIVTIAPNDIDNESLDNCDFSLSLDTDSFNESHVGSPQTVMLTVTDSSNNTTTASSIVTVLPGKTPFVTVWRTTTANETITLPIISEPTYSHTIDWGDESVPNNQATHTYATPGDYEISVISDFITFSANSTPDKEKIVEIKQWGDTRWASMVNAYNGCANLTYSATDAPDLSEVTSLYRMFVDCTVFNGNLNNWDLSTILDTRQMFNNASSFNGDINSWDVSNVSNMNRMFTNATSFNQDLGNWNVSQVVNMANMFSGATMFNQNLGHWNISNMSAMVNMLNNTALSIENYDNTIIGWATLDAGETQIPTNVTVGVTGLNYCQAQVERQNLMTMFGWGFSGDTFFCGVNVELKAYLQGSALSPNANEDNLMRDDLRVTGLLPSTSPYIDALTSDASVFNSGGSSGAGISDDDIVDWVLVELRDENDNTLVLHQQSALLQRDGDIVDVDGTSILTLGIPSSNFYVVVKHRNHLGIMSSSPVMLSETITFIDFTNANNPITFGTNAQTSSGMPSGIVGMWAGDVNGDNVIQYSGTNPDSPSILSEVLNDSGNFLNFPTYVVNGYNIHDINMDGKTQYSGTTPDTPYILQNIFSHPGNFLNFSTFQILEQLP